MKPLEMFHDLEPQAKCNMCGKCCEVIALPIPPEHLDPASGMRYVDSKFMFENFVPVDAETARSINPHIIIESEELLNGTEQYFYTCKQYDKENKLCMAHEQRPHVCSGFPWYNKPIHNIALRMHMSCSYWEDVPVEAWPDGVMI